MKVSEVVMVVGRQEGHPA